MVRIVDEPVDLPRHENIQRRNLLSDALQLAQGEVRRRLREGYRHADYIDQWTILKRGADIFRIRIESPAHHTPVPTGVEREPLLWVPGRLSSGAALAAERKN